MYPAVAACRFPFLERTFGEASLRVIKKSSALAAESTTGLMFGMTVNIYHRLNSLSFSFHSLFFIGIPYDRSLYTFREYYALIEEVS